MSHRYVEGRSPIDIVLARAATFAKDADREIQTVLTDSRGRQYLGWAYAYSSKERASLKKQAAEKLDEALRLEAEFATETASTRSPAPFAARAGGPPSRAARKRGRW